jgi:hypothetical protein
MLKNISNIFRGLRPTQALKTYGINPALLYSYAFLNKYNHPAFSQLVSNNSFGFSTITPNTSKPKDTPVGDSITIDKVKQEVVDRVKKAFESRANFAGKDTPVNKLIYELKTRGTPLDYYDYLMVLSITNMSNPHDPIVKTLPNDIQNAHQILRMFIEKPDSLPELMEHGNLFKLMWFISEFSFKQFHQNAKQFHNLFSKIMVSRTFTDETLLDIFINKLGYVNRTLYDRRHKTKVMDVLRATLIMVDKKQFLSKLPQETEKNNFVIPDQREKDIFKIVNIINHLLFEDSTPQIIKVVDNFLNQLTQITYVAKLSLRIASSLLETPYFIAKNSEYQTFKYGELILFCNDIIIEHKSELSPEKFTRVLFMISRLNMFQINYGAYHKFVNFFLEYLVANMDKFNHEQLKSNLYGIGFHSVTSPEILQLYGKLLDVADIRTKNSYPKFPVYVKNLVISALNIYAIEKGPKLSAILKYIVQDMKLARPGAEFYDLISFTKLATILRRADCFDPIFWEEFFRAIPDIAQMNKEVGYDLLFILRSFEIFEDEGKDPNSDSYQAVKFLNTFKATQGHIYQEIMKFNMKEVIEKGQFDQVSSLNHQIKLVCENLGKPYSEEPLGNRICVF